jgi:hypothetical protein
MSLTKSILMRFWISGEQNANPSVFVSGFETLQRYEKNNKINSFKAFNVLRKQGNLILTLFALMASSGDFFK